MKLANWVQSEFVIGRSRLSGMALGGQGKFATTVWAKA
jgi:hypothetical protein